MNNVQSDLVQVIRLALGEQTEDVRLFVARLIRKYRSEAPELSDQMDGFLRTNPPKGQSVLRKALPKASTPSVTMPVDDESRLSLLKVFEDRKDQESPLLSKSIHESLQQLILEREQADRLIAAGLQPTRSAIFVGAPGVGKTITARWLAAQLGVPLYVLDLSAVMSSLLGRSGNNLRTALDFAKRTPCVLLLDEIDAVAKRRSDESDIGELKRLVTVILQEVDEWPATGLLLAATNHPEMIDPALWRRFDLEVEFKAPEPAAIRAAIKRFMGPDFGRSERWTEVLEFAFQGQSFSDIERDIQRFRRALVLKSATEEALIEDLIKSRALALERPTRIEFAVLLSKHTRFSQHTISEITSVSRDTIRKYTSEAAAPPKKNSRKKISV